MHKTYLFQYFLLLSIGILSNHFVKIANNKALRPDTNKVRMHTKMLRSVQSGLPSRARSQSARSATPRLRASTFRRSLFHLYPGDKIFLERRDGRLVSGLELRASGGRKNDVGSGDDGTTAAATAALALVPPPVVPEPTLRSPSEAAARRKRRRTDVLACAVAALAPPPVPEAAADTAACDTAAGMGTRTGAKILKDIGMTPADSATSPAQPSPSPPVAVVLEHRTAAARGRGADASCVAKEEGIVEVAPGSEEHSAAPPAKSAVAEAGYVPSERDAAAAAAAAAGGPPGDWPRSRSGSGDGGGGGGGIFRNCRFVFWARRQARDVLARVKQAGGQEQYSVGPSTTHVVARYDTSAEEASQLLRTSDLEYDTDAAASLLLPPGVLFVTVNYIRDCLAQGRQLVPDPAAGHLIELAAPAPAVRPPHLVTAEAAPQSIEQPPSPSQSSLRRGRVAATVGTAAATAIGSGGGGSGGGNSLPVGLPGPDDICSRPEDWGVEDRWMEPWDLELAKRTCRLLLSHWGK
ncbi:hypothetical protein Vafri_18696 [Volvox africanus]|uniref:BRCT domain-containing protein n=1 Tax=Volvox africanus TaxID=51714 RepID=A0A8J4BLP5_9CHLO|nr:hypothetical protein Vafri_18696 [Volvox africanus]